MKKITKVVIPTAGLGTRFLPATKSVPKELLPIVDKPNLLYIVEEAVKAGIEDIIFVTGRNKEAIEDFFDVSYEVEDILYKAGKTKILEQLQSIRKMANYISIRQNQALGLGHAVHTAKPILGDDDFAVMLGDELMIGEHGGIAELIQQYNHLQKSTVAVMQVPKKDVSKYGVIDGSKTAERTYKIHRLVEKPNVDEAPSNLALPGRYVFSNAILKQIEQTKAGKNNEIQLTDAMDALAKKDSMFAYECQSTRYDTGDKLGYLIANIEIGLKHPEVGADLKQFILDISKRI